MKVLLDENLPHEAYQRNLATLPVAVVVLTAASNDMADLRPLVPGLLQAIGSIAPRTIITIQ
jgi:hypothetical protein